MAAPLRQNHRRNPLCYGKGPDSATKNKKPTTLTQVNRLVLPKKTLFFLKYLLKRLILVFELVGVNRLV